MTTNIAADLDRLRHLDARAVRDSVSLVRQVTRDDLLRPTPCGAWTLADLLGHMTAQHRGFAAAALGHGQDLTHWTVRPLADAATEYGEAAEQVITAFATVADPDHPFALPELPGERFPAVHAIAFHLVDYVVHTWDVARSLGRGYDAAPELLAAALPVARAVPDGDFRLAPDSPFRPALPADDGAGTLERILMALGRWPSWGDPNPAVRDTAC